MQMIISILNQLKKYLVLCLVWLLIACRFTSLEIDKNPLLPQKLQPDAVPAVDSQANALLSYYGWSVKSRLAAYHLTLPATFEHAPGTFPIAIYWAYNHEFSQEIGLPLKPLLGKRVIAIIYDLNESLPDFLYPYTVARAVVLIYEGNIAGAWIDKGRHHAFACSLNRKSFDEIVNQSWGEWLVTAGVVQRNHSVEKELAALSPEQLIERYVVATNQQADHKYFFSTRKSLLGYLFANMGDTALFNRSFADAYDDLRMPSRPTRRAINSADIQLLATGENMREYRVDGLGFVILQEEVEGKGWRIDGIGTGP